MAVQIPVQNGIPVCDEIAKTNNDATSFGGAAIVAGELESQSHCNGPTASIETASLTCHALEALGNHTPTTLGDPPSSIAICGMACRLPGGIKAPSQLWEFLLNGGDARSKVPTSRYNLNAFYDPSGKPGTINTEYGYFLDEDLGNLDTSFYAMPLAEVERMDPQQRLLLEVARESVEDAGETGWRGTNIGCYVGVLGDDWLEMLAQDSQSFGKYRLTGYGDFSLSNRVSYEMDLKGPSITIRTACSSSMVAFHEACVAINRGDCASAIVGGTNLIMRPHATALMSEQGILSSDGSCKTFSALADGYARGEAIVAVFLKPLADALRDGNSIRAIVRATATNHDGKTSGFNLPSADAQETMIRKAYDIAGLDVHHTGYVECHGTGTPVGDPIETTAVARVFGDYGVTIGSIKPNFGHTEGSSGLLSIIKTVLAMEHRTIPPSIKCRPRNPSIPWETGKLSLADDAMPWPTGRLTRASVNSFGLGGSNAHAILDSAADYKSEPDINRLEDAQLLLYSANTPQSLATLVGNYSAFIKDTTPDVKQIAYTLARGREHLPHRAFAIAKGLHVGPASPVTKPSQQQPKIVMVFSGQGAQWATMGISLLQSNLAFQSSIRALDGHLQDLGDDAPEWSIEEELGKPVKTSRVLLAEFSQPLCTALQLALVDTLRSVGVEPDAVVGHSSGELAAAYAAGALTAKEAIVAAFYRGTVAGRSTKAGAMAAIGMSVTETQKFLVPNTCIACDNSLQSVTISGDADGVDEVLQKVRLARSEVLARRLQVDKAYHSHHMAELGDLYNDLIESKIVEKVPTKLFFSSVENKLLERTATLGSRYWQKNLERPVLFNGAVTALLHHFSEQHVILIEVGPHSALAGPLAQIMSGIPNNARYVATLVRHQDSVENLLSTMGKLFTFNYPIDTKAMFPVGTCLPDLPRYPFQYNSSQYWFETRLSKEYRLRQYPHHDLLGIRVVESTDIAPMWRNLLHLHFNTSWLRDHKVGDDIVLPLAGYIAIAGEAIRQTTKVEYAFRMRNISVESALLLNEQVPVEIITMLRPIRNSTWYELTISAHNGHQWIQHCSGEVKAESESPPVGCPTKPLARVLQDSDRWFEAVRRGGLDLGDQFRNLHGISASTTRQESRGTVSGSRYSNQSPPQYHIHPAVVDSALQLIYVAAATGLARKHRNFLPVSCKELFVARTTEDFLTNVRVADMVNSSTNSYASNGQGLVGSDVVLEFQGLQMDSASITGDPATDLDPHAAARLTWAADLNFVDLGTLFESTPNHLQDASPLDTLSQLVLQAIHQKLAQMDMTKYPHMARYAQWVEQRFREVDGTRNSDGNPLLQLDEAVSSAKLLGSSVAAVAGALHSLVSNLQSSCDDASLSWRPLLSADELSGLYDVFSESPSSDFHKAIGHYKPNLRVLEIGDWSNSPSRTALRSLKTPSGHRLWSQYTFVCRQGVAMNDRATEWPNVDYAAFDVNEDSFPQDFEHRQYDLIICNNALHACPDVVQVLRNIKKILAPEGRLLIQQLSPASDWLDIILRLDAAYWSKNRHSESQPYRNPAQWSDALRLAGFRAPYTAALDSELVPQTNMIVVAQSETEADEKPKSVSLLSRGPTSIYDDMVKNVLLSKGYEVSRITLKDIPDPNNDIVSIIDLEGPFLKDINEGEYRDLQDFLANVGRSGIFWITKSCHIRVQDPDYAQIIGLARVVRSELLLDFATCEIDNLDTALPSVIQVYEKFRARTDEGKLRSDFEYAIDNGTIHIGRYFPFIMTNDFVQTTGKASSRRQLQLDPTGTYLLVGGLGGIGRAIATHMVEHGARSFVFLGRRAGISAADQDFVRELQSMDVDVVTVRGSVTELEDVTLAVAKAPRPLRGVLQLTAVLDDENFSRMSMEQWHRSVQPKVLGTWNLHDATASLDLDFIVLFSSIAGVIGNPGQANYASANTFLDAFVQYRNGLGLACSAIDIGPVADIGLLAKMPELLPAAVLFGSKVLQEQEVLDAVALSMMPAAPESSQQSPGYSDPNVFVLGLQSDIAMDSPSNRAVWKQDRRMAIYHNQNESVVETSVSSSDQLQAYLVTARTSPLVLEAPETAHYLGQQIGLRLFELLLKEDTEVDTSLSLADLGLDSLIAIELRSWWKKAFGFDISVLEMLAMADLNTLGKHVSERLLQMFEIM